MKNVYLVVNKWATEDASDTSITVFEKYEDAREEMQKQIKQEINENMSQAFENDEPVDGYCVEEGIDYWECWEDGYYSSNFVNISIEKKEVL